MSSVSPFVGIDFGTSKCAMAFYDPDREQAKLIRNDEEEYETPSVVYLGKSEKDIIVGKVAEKMLTNGSVDQRTLSVSVKRDLTRSSKIMVLDEQRKYRPEDIAALLLKKLKADAEIRRFYEPVTRAVITFPTAFDSTQKDKIRLAAKLAGFTEVELLEEPIAAALAFKYEGLKVGKCIMVYDFGAGTFDIAVLSQLSDQKFTWGATPKGLKDCGGDDLDRALYDYCDEKAHRDLKRGISLDGEINLRFLHECRERKENLSYQEEATFSSYLASNNGPVSFPLTLSRAKFEERIQTYIDKTVALTQKVLNEAKAKGNTVDTVVLIGGSTKVPLVLKKLSNTLPMAPLQWDEREYAVALGAAYYGAQLWSPTMPRYWRYWVDSSLDEKEPSSSQKGKTNIPVDDLPQEPPITTSSTNATTPPPQTNQPKGDQPKVNTKPGNSAAVGPSPFLSPAVRKRRWTTWRVIALLAIIGFGYGIIYNVVTPSSDQTANIIIGAIIVVFCLFVVFRKPKAK